MPWHESIIESELAKTKVLINATSIGLTVEATPVPGEILTADLLVLDLIYDRTKLLLATPRRPARATSDGELMLLHQGAAAFTLWTRPGGPARRDAGAPAAKKAARAGAALGRGRADRRGRAGEPSRPEGRIRAAAWAGSGS